MNPSHKQFEPFTYKKLNDLEKKIAELGLDIPIYPRVEILQQRVNINNLFIPNRLAIQPMEGFDANLDGTPGKLTYRRYERYAKSGAGLIWFEATAITEDCRSNPHQLVLSEKNVKKFKELVSFTRNISNKTLRKLGFDNKVILILQLNHSGRYCIRDGKKYPIRAYLNKDFDKAKGLSEKDGIVISDDQLKEIEEKWIQKAVLAKGVGFDGVDIKSCHGYLIHELFSSRLRKNSKYGGNPLKNRASFFLNIIKELNKKMKNERNFIITTRMSVYDGIPYPYGFGVKPVENENFPALLDLTEPLKVINKLYKQGVRLINITAGNPHYKPQITRPFDIPVKGGTLPNEHPLYGVSRLLNLATLIKNHLPEDMVVVGSGYSYLRQFAGYIAAGMAHEKRVDVCAFGRMALANPNFPKQIFQEGILDKKQVCITCSKCSEFMKLRKNVGCATRDPQYQS
ncbi:MAG: flavin oxidoreductase/NADH oxidase [Candidatus Lokiarchaeota archaeon]|nr:flavin oxidoreductase/NADH oxidase [Candidatus Lokiarchaeota archaeon]